ncbi:MarR family winged helix-turn-helix transcriptional regulator [Salinarimonas sp. NSM]|uniref:MarR family winged helix-turn-helix transcriptional regulator n=1 Tax=Salinarimonas sp. NSM TaxID=3458003 RepID=UPI00403519E8
MRTEHMLCLSLHAASRAMTRAYQPLLDALGLTYPQYVVLMTLWDEDSQPVGAIGRRLMLDTNTLTPMLKRMEAAGLVRRSRSALDERQVIVSLTEAGRAMEARAAHVPARIVAATGLSPEALRDLNARVTALKDSLGREE